MQKKSVASACSVFSRRAAWRSMMVATSMMVLWCAPSYATSASKNEEKTQSTYELLNLFGDVFERVRRDYVEEISEEKLIEAALNGMLTSLDPHSGYLNKDHFKEMKVQTKGEFGGLGIEVSMENGLVKVVSPIDDTPAAKAGVQAGDYISQIDGEAVMGLNLSEAVEKMRGPVGTNIKITILREGEKEPLDIIIKRDLIKIQSVRSHLEGDVGYVRITSFSEKTTPTMIESIAKLKKELPNMAGLVLDLRNNPGGLLDQAITVSDAFLERGEIVSTRERNPNDTQRFSATPGDVLDNLPIVVLINQGSASASEIVAGALKDHRRAVIMGTKSFGKGSVQTVIPLEDHGAMRLTTSLYYTPSGISIQAKGIEPDIIVKPAKVEEITQEGLRSEAELRGRLQNGNDRDAKKLGKSLPEMVQKFTKSKEEMSDKTKDDYQLSRAVDLIRGLHLYQSHVVPPATVNTGTSKKN
ncbi:MAG: S41 family peptidase [Alphaproteobacteria bacterium]|nr:MAG: S41 family peptidase [Alphaproteobacteria bacterium]TAF76712.1 MAG: S41 family peptidase [Alphaproteobacteria bacterium]